MSLFMGSITSYENVVTLDSVETDNDESRELKIKVERLTKENELFRLDSALREADFEREKKNFVIENVTLRKTVENYEELILNLKNINSCEGKEKKFIWKEVLIEEGKKRDFLASCEISTLKNEISKLSKEIEELHKEKILNKKYEDDNCDQKLKEMIFELSIEFDDLKNKFSSISDELIKKEETIIILEKNIEYLKDKQNYKISLENEIFVLEGKLNAKINDDTNKINVKLSCKEIKSTDKINIQKISPQKNKSKPKIVKYSKLISNTILLQEKNIKNTNKSIFHYITPQRKVSIINRSRNLIMESPEKNKRSPFCTIDNSQIDKKPKLKKELNFKTIDFDKNQIDFNLMNPIELKQIDIIKQKEEYENKIQSIEEMYQNYIDRLEADINKSRENFKLNDKIESKENYESMINNLKYKNQELENKNLKVEFELSQKIEKLKDELNISQNYSSNFKNSNKMLEINIQNTQKKLEVIIHENNTFKSQIYKKNLDINRLNDLNLKFNEEGLTLSNKIKENDLKIDKNAEENRNMRCEIIDQKIAFEEQLIILKRKYTNCKFKLEDNCEKLNKTVPRVGIYENFGYEKKTKIAENNFLSNQNKILRIEYDEKVKNFKKDQNLLLKDLENVNFENICLKSSLANLTFENESEIIKSNTIINRLKSLNQNKISSRRSSLIK